MSQLYPTRATSRKDAVPPYPQGGAATVGHRKPLWASALLGLVLVPAPQGPTVSILQWQLLSSSLTFLSETPPNKVPGKATLFPWNCSLKGCKYSNKLSSPKRAPNKHPKENKALMDANDTGFPTHFVQVSIIQLHTQISPHTHFAPVHHIPLHIFCLPKGTAYKWRRISTTLTQNRMEKGRSSTSWDSQHHTKTPLFPLRREPGWWMWEWKVH